MNHKRTQKKSEPQMSYWGLVGEQGSFLGWTCEPHLAVTSFLKYTLVVLAFKCVKGLAPSYLCHRFKTRDCVHDRNTRYKNNLNIPAYKSASGQRTFLYRATSFWNSLPCEIRGCDNLPIFKRHLKEFLSSF